VASRAPLNCIKLFLGSSTRFLGVTWNIFCFRRWRNLIWHGFFLWRTLFCCSWSKFLFNTLFTTGHTILFIICDHTDSTYQEKKGAQASSEGTQKSHVIYNHMKSFDILSEKLHRRNILQTLYAEKSHIKHNVKIHFCPKGLLCCILADTYHVTSFEKQKRCNVKLYIKKLK